MCLLSKSAHLWCASTWLTPTSTCLFSKFTHLLICVDVSCSYVDVASYTSTLHIVLVAKSQHVFWICRHGYCYVSTHLSYVSTCLHIFNKQCVDTSSLWVGLLVMSATYCVDTHNICVDLLQCIFQVVSTHKEYVSTFFNCKSTCL